MTVAQNVAFDLQNLDKKQTFQVKERTAEAIALVGLEGLETCYPHELSGGQQQRVALARALAPRPALVLLDEPLSNLDVQLRLYLRQEVREILKATRTSAIFVTHDQEEALAISDCVAVMRQGKLEQIGSPEAIYREPASQFVAEFVTQANFLPAQRRGQGWQTEVGHFKVDLSGCQMLTADQSELDAGALMIRQEELILRPDANAAVVICDRQFLGSEYRYCLLTPSGRRLHARTIAATALPVGTRVQLSVTSQSLQVFPTSAALHWQSAFSSLAHVN